MNKTATVEFSQFCSK